MYYGVIGFKYVYKKAQGISQMIITSLTYNFQKFKKKSSILLSLSGMYILIIIIIYMHM